MLLTIHNLPDNFRYEDVKSLIQAKCGISEVILDNLTSMGSYKKVTVGLAEDGDAAILVRKIHGIYLQGQQLHVEDVRKKRASEQPYYSARNLLKATNQSRDTFVNPHSDRGQFNEYQTDMTTAMCQQNQPMMPSEAMGMVPMSYDMSMSGMYFMPSMTQQGSLMCFNAGSQQQQAMAPTRPQFPKQENENVSSRTETAYTKIQGRLMQGVSANKPNKNWQSNRQHELQERVSNIQVRAREWANKHQWEGETKARANEYSPRNDQSWQKNDTNRSWEDSSVQDRDRNWGHETNEQDTGRDWGRNGNRQYGNTQASFGSGQGSGPRNPNPNQMRRANRSPLRESSDAYDPSDCFDNFPPRNRAPVNRPNMSAKQLNAPTNHRMGPRFPSKSYDDNIPERPVRVSAPKACETPNSWEQPPSEDRNYRKSRWEEAAATRGNQDKPWGDRMSFQSLYTYDKAPGAGGHRPAKPFENRSNEDRSRSDTRNRDSGRRYDNRWDEHEGSPAKRFAAQSADRNVPPKGVWQWKKIPNPNNNQPAPKHRQDSPSSKSAPMSANELKKQRLKKAVLKVPAKPKPIKIGTLLNRDNTWRQQAASQIAKKMISNLQISGCKEYNKEQIVNALKSSIKTRIDVLLNNRFSVPVEELVQMYEKQFPSSGDQAFFLAVVDNIKSGLFDKVKAERDTPLEKKPPGKQEPYEPTDTAQPNPGLLKIIDMKHEQESTSKRNSSSRDAAKKQDDWNCLKGTRNPGTSDNSPDRRPRGTGAPSSGGSRRKRIRIRRKSTFSARETSDDCLSLINSGNTRLSQAASQIAKALLRNLEIIGREDNKDQIFFGLKSCIRMRLEVILGDKVYLPVRELVKMYGERFPSDDDEAFFADVLEDIRAGLFDKDNSEMDSSEEKVNEAIKRNVFYKNDTLGEKKFVTSINNGQPSSSGVTPWMTTGRIEIPKREVAQKNAAAKNRAGNKILEKRKVQEIRRLERIETRRKLLELPPLVQKAVDEHTSVLCDVFMGACEGADSEVEKTVCERITDQAADHFRAHIRLNITKRLLNYNTTLRVRIYNDHKKLSFPRRELMEQFLANYGVTHLRKQEKKKEKLYVATCTSYYNYDRLIALGAAQIDGIMMYFKASNIRGPPQKMTLQEVAKRRQRYVDLQIDHSDVSLLQPASGEQNAQEVKPCKQEVEENSEEVEKIKQEDEENLEEVEQIKQEDEENLEEVKQIKQKAEEISEEVEQNSEEMDQISEEVKQNGEEVEQHKQEVEENSEEMEQNWQEIQQDTEDNTGCDEEYDQDIEASFFQPETGRNDMSFTEDDLEDY